MGFSVGGTTFDAVNILLAFFIGVLCGLVPFAYGLLTKHKILAIVSLTVCALSGIGFQILDKSPFTAIGFAVIFIVFLFAKNKNQHSEAEDDEEDYLKDE